MNRRTMAIVRAATIVTATIGLVTGVTFAQLSSQATLTNSSITTATAQLLVWDGSAFNSTAPGFTVTNLIPGTPLNYPLYLQNNGGTTLGITAHVPTLPAASGFTGWDSVKVVITDDSSLNPTATAVHTDLQALNSGEVALPAIGAAFPAGAQGNSGVPGTVGNFHVSFDIDPSAINASQATVGNFDIVLTGTAQ